MHQKPSGMHVHHQLLNNSALDPKNDLAAFVCVAKAVRATGYRFVTITPASHALVNARPSNRKASTLNGALGWSPGDSIRTDTSGKYAPTEFAELIAAAGWTPMRSWTSGESGYALHLLHSLTMQSRL
jgi:hypothetical protein